MISVTLNTSATNLTFAINSRRSKNEIATTYVCYLRRIWPVPGTKTPKKYGRSEHGMCTCDYRTHWHLLIGRAISSVIAVSCRWCVFLSCPLKLQRGDTRGHLYCKLWTVDNVSGKLSLTSVSFCSHYNCCLCVWIMHGMFDITTGTQHKWNDVNRRESVGVEWAGEIYEHLCGRTRFRLKRIDVSLHQGEREDKITTVLHQVQLFVL